MFEREELVRTDDVRVVQISMGAGEQLTWHYHSQIRESIFCLAGELRVLSARREQTLRTGQKASFTAGEAHALQNPGRQVASYLLIQHGPYDFIECAAPSGS